MSDAFVQRAAPACSLGRAPWRLCWGLGAVLLSLASPAGTACAAEATSPTATDERIQAVIPDVEKYIESGMQSFDVPGLTVGIVANDRLVYAKGFGATKKQGGSPVDTHTLFQIGSTTKAFLAATMAIMVDRKKLAWNARVAELDPDFQLMDPWVTREFRVYDLLAQRSGLPPYVNDTFGVLGFDEPALIRSLRTVRPVSSFRSTFAYTNVTHMLAGRVVAKAAGLADWNQVLETLLLSPLGMKETSYTAAAIEASSNHAEGHRWTPEGTVQVPFTELFPYGFAGAGDINSNVADLAHWLRMQLGNGTFEGQQIVSAGNLALTRVPRVGITDKVSYAMGWVIRQSDNGTVVWHNGGTSAFGAYIGMIPARGVGIVVLTNEVNIGLPDAVGAWTLDRILDNPPVDYAANSLEHARESADESGKRFARPANPRPFPPTAPLAGEYASAAFGKAGVTAEGDALIVVLRGTGAKLKLEPWDGDIFTAKLIGEGRFAPVVADAGPLPDAFAQFVGNKNGHLTVLRFTTEDGQAYAFRRAE